MSKFNVVFVLGGPGSGKGTQCQKIAKEFGYHHLSVGELLRAEVKKKGEHSEMIEQHNREGSTVPGKVAINLVDFAMRESGKENFLLDGVPRNQENLDRWTETMNDKAVVKFVLFFDCPEEECAKRCSKRDRGDDNEYSIPKRIATFTNSTMPIVKHYQSQGLVKTIDAAQSIDQVFEDVKKAFSAS